MPRDSIPSGKGYALWLMPSEPTFSRLAREISGLSREYSTPRFEPHVTLLSRILLPEENALARSASFAGMLKPTRIRMGGISHLDEYFHCLFVTVVPSDSITQAHRLACNVFGHRDAAYTPHISLAYGKLPAETNTRLAADLSSLSGQAFSVRSFALYWVNGSPREWKCAKRFELK